MKTVLTHRYLCLELVRNQPGGFGAKYFGGFKKKVFRSTTGIQQSVLFWY